MAETSTADLVETVRRAAAELARRETPASAMASAELAESLGRALDVLEAALAPVVRHVDSSGVHGLLGHSSPTAWLRATLGMRHGRASERVRLARRLSRLPDTAERLRSGRPSRRRTAASPHRRCHRWPNRRALTTTVTTHNAPPTSSPPCSLEATGTRTSR